MDFTYSKLTDVELSEKLRELNKRIFYIVRTNLHASTLPQLRGIQAHLLIEARSRMEKKKVDIYNKYFPGESKIIGEEDGDEEK